jgi:hypothetical protein
MPGLFKFLEHFAPTKDPYGKANDPPIQPDVRMTEEEWWSARMLDRVWNPRKPCDLRDPRNVYDWAIGVRRPGEGCGASEAHVDSDAAAYIAECCTIAQELRETDTTLHRRLLHNRSVRATALGLAKQARDFANRLEQHVLDDDQ